jgi:hypothetical protein
MMFSTQEPRRTGIVTRFDVPLNRYLSAAWEQGVEDSAFSSVAQITENYIWGEGNRISAEEANKKYAVEGLNFQTPVYESVARMMRDRHQRRLDRELMLQSAPTFSGRWWGGLGVGVLASFTNPLDFALNFIPIVGSERAASLVGRGALRQSLARGLITEEALMASRVPFPRIAGALIEGAAGQAVAEVPIRIAKEMNLEEYGAEQSFLNIAAGSVMGGAIHLGVSSAARLLRRLHPETKKVLFQQAAEQFLTGENINVHKFVEIDEAKIRERVSFDRNQAEFEAGLNVNERDVKATVRKRFDDERIISAAIKTEDGKVHLGPSHFMIFENFQENSTDGFVTNYGRFVSREEAAAWLSGLADDRDKLQRTGYTKTAREIHPANPGARPEVFAEDFEFFEGMDAWSKYGDWPEIRSQHLQNLRRDHDEFFEQPHVRQALETERQRRINEFVNQRIKEYDPDTALKNEVLAEIDRQKVEGRILHPDEATKWGFTREEMAQTETLLKEDVDTLKEELGIEDEMLDEDAVLLKEVPEHWVVTVQHDAVDNGKTIPSGFVQIDDPAIGPDGANLKSSSPDTLRKEGYYIPDVDFKSLPQGKHTIKEAYEVLGAKPFPSPEELALLSSVKAPEIDMVDAAVDCLTRNIT